MHHAIHSTDQLNGCARALGRKQNEKKTSFKQVKNNGNQQNKRRTTKTQNVRGSTVMI